MAKTQDNSFKDVSQAQEQAEKEAREPLKVDDDGNPTNLVSEAGVEVAEEQAHRAAAQANGGGPWPADLLAERYVGNKSRLRRDVSAEYTSHEEKHG